MTRMIYVVLEERTNCALGRPESICDRAFNTPGTTAARGRLYQLSSDFSFLHSKTKVTDSVHCTIDTGGQTPCIGDRVYNAVSRRIWQMKSSGTHRHLLELQQRHN
jgi:hypothetical protein